MRSRSRDVALVTGLGVGVVVVALVSAATLRPAGPRESELNNLSAESAATVPVAAPNAEKPRAPEPARVSLTLDDPDLSASLARVAAEALERTRPSVSEIVTRNRTCGPGDLLIALESHLRGAPEGARELIELMRTEDDPATVFVMARALGRTLDRAETRTLALGLLRDLSPARRADALVALMGRREPETVEFLLQVLENDPSDDARARAASLLVYVTDDLGSDARRRAQTVARATLASSHHHSSARIAAAAEILGRPGALPEDLDLLGQELLRTPDPELLASLAYSLGSGGVPPAALRALLAKRQGDPLLEDVVARLLAAMP